MSLLCARGVRPDDTGAARATCTPMLGEHLSECDEAQCRGCLPRLAEPGLMVCRACRLRTSDRLLAMPQLHVDLLTPTRSAVGGGGGGPGGAARRIPYSDGPMDVRVQIRHLLGVWCQVLRRDWHESMPAPEVTAMAGHVWWHHLSLLADAEHADQLVYDVDTMTRWASRYAYPSGPVGQPLGACPSCGTTIRASDPLGQATCSGCGTLRTVEEWQRVLVGDLTHSQAAIGPDIAAWLSAKYARHVTGTAVRLWVSKGISVARGTGERMHLTRVGTDSAHRALYSVADAARIGHALYGPTRR